MPFLLINETREIFEITKCPEGRWLNINISCKRLVNQHFHDIEWEYAPAWGLMNLVNGDVILQYKDMAHDVEYYYRGSDNISYTPGSPNSVQF